MDATALLRSDQERQEEGARRLLRFRKLFCIPQSPDIRNARARARETKKGKVGESLRLAALARVWSTHSPKRWPSFKARAFQKLSLARLFRASRLIIPARSEQCVTWPPLTFPIRKGAGARIGAAARARFHRARLQRDGQHARRHLRQGHPQQGPGVRKRQDRAR